MRLVIVAGHADAAREIDDGLLFRQHTQHVHRSLKSGELAIGIKEVEFTGVLAEDAARVVTVVIVRIHQLGESFAKRIAIVREILKHADSALSKGHDRNQVGGLHLIAYEFVGRGECAELIGWRRRHHVEKQNQEAMIAVSSIRTSGRGGRRWRRRGRGRQRRRGRGRRRRIVQLLKLEDADRLRNVIFGDREVFFGEPFDRLSVFVLHDHCLNHQLGIHFDREWLLLQQQKPKQDCWDRHLRTSAAGLSARCASG